MYTSIAQSFLQPLCHHFLSPLPIYTPQPGPRQLLRAHYRFACIFLSFNKWHHKVSILFSSSFFHCSVITLTFYVIHTLLLFMAEWCSPVYISHILFIHSLADGHLGCFCSVAVTNKAAINIREQVCVWTCFHFFWVNTEWNGWDIAQACLAF